MLRRAASVSQPLACNLCDRGFRQPEQPNANVNRVSIAAPTEVCTLMTTAMPLRETRNLSVVAVGSFNPAIFHPAWFAANDLIRKDEADESTVQLVHNQATIFSTSWFVLKVDQNRFHLETADPSKAFPLRDLALGTFELLEHTPLRAVGFNLTDVYQMSSEQCWHQFGDYFAPKQSWNALLEKPDMATLIIKGTRPESIADYNLIRAEPADGVEFGVRLALNQHYALDTPPDKLSDPKLIELKKFAPILQNEWDEFLKYSDNVASHLFKECKNVEQKV